MMDNKLSELKAFVSISMIDCRTIAMYQSRFPALRFIQHKVISNGNSVMVDRQTA